MTTSALSAASPPLRAMRARYQVSLAATLAALDAHAAQLDRDPAAAPVIEALRRELHRVVGSAGTFGFVAAGLLARGLEQQVLCWAEDPSADATVRGRLLRDGVRGLALLLEAAAAPPGDASPPSAVGRGPAAPGSAASIPTAPVPAARVPAARVPAAPPRDTAATPHVVDPDVVVVDDDPSITRMLEFGLAQAGLRAATFHTGTDALHALRTMPTAADRRPLVLLDVDLPGLDGHALHERLQVERPGAFAFVFLSAHASESDQVRTLAGGALDHLGKPFSLRVVMAKVPRWLGRAPTAQ